MGASFAGAASGYDDLLTFDMGGTSTDVAPVIGGEAQTTTDAVVAGVPIRHPMVDVHTVSAGGGSIARADAGGALRVGPRSAGAEPGPACYDRGGEDATVTDANLFLGLLADGAELGGGEVTLRRELAERALAATGEPLGLDAQETALGVVRVADAEMVRALRVVSVERGLDPREFALAAFGGAGGMHACSLAEELGMTTVLIPRAGGVLSALGLAISDERRDFVGPLIGALDGLERDDDRGGLRRAGGDGRRGAGGRRAAPPRRPALPPPGVRADRRGGRPRRAGRALPRGARAALRLRDAGGAGRAGGRARDRDPAGGQARAERGRARGRRRGRAAEDLHRRRVDRGRRCSTARAWARAAPCRGPRSSSRARRHASSGPAGRAGSTVPGRWCSNGRRTDEARPGHPVRALERPVGHRRGDGRRAHPRRLLLQHQGAARLLGRALRRRGPDGGPGRAHPRAPGRDARGGRGRDGARPGPGRRLRRQRPVLGRHAPARHHARLPHGPRRQGARLRGHPGAPLGRRRDESRLDARRLARAVPGGARDPAAAAAAGGRVRRRRARPDPGQRAHAGGPAR